jgi:hypothetical protein
VELKTAFANPAGILVASAFASWLPGGLMFGHRTIGYHEFAEGDHDIIVWGHDHSREKTTKDSALTRNSASR